VDVDWAIATLSAYRELLDGYDIRSRGVVGNKWDVVSAKDIETMIDKALGTVQVIGTKLRPGIEKQLIPRPMGNGKRYTSGARQACDILIGDLGDQEERAQHLQPKSPQLSADALHPWVWQAASPTRHRTSASPVFVGPVTRPTGP
jgi:hypothetical protein